MLNPSATNLRVGGVTRLSSVDWPGELAATVFCQGCGWDCAYCHNPGLRPAQGKEQLSWPAIFEFLEHRRGLLDAVVFSGGDPLVQPVLAEAIAKVKALGFKIGLHTGGMLPARFREVLPLLDWVGFDVKAPFDKYEATTGVAHSGEAALESLHALLASGVRYEIRTTVHPALLPLEDLLTLRATLLALGVTHYAVQRFRTEGTRAEALPAPAAAYPLPEDFANGFAHFELR